MSVLPGRKFNYKNPLRLKISRYIRPPEKVLNLLLMRA